MLLYVYEVLLAVSEEYVTNVIELTKGDGVGVLVTVGVTVVVGVTVGLVVTVGVTVVVGVMDGVTLVVGVLVGVVVTVGVTVVVGVTVLVGVIEGVGVGDTTGPDDVSGTFIINPPTQTLPGCFEPGGYIISLIFGCLLGAWYGRNLIFYKYIRL
jgi:hypothetical protein